MKVLGQKDFGKFEFRSESLKLCFFSDKKAFGDMTLDALSKHMMVFAEGRKEHGAELQTLALAEDFCMVTHA